ncbi:putative hydrolase [Mobilisporobacter senegalensis]|uniref:Putative hydrolase n=1 Tax=Mobilisporobacter senegalensis TaxID=1329262 RepID=A0A3N1XN63_9FIRM|nr:phosphatase [Mobilisporobacter senegalensis]ROR28140.1 putative hydrolase [Mobilisporobacter senegalensis]
MNIVIDTHSHTIASGHAYNTIEEMAKAASEKGIKLLAITEHAPNMPGTCHDFYFHNLKVVTRMRHGVELLLGVELNVIDYEGNVDLDDETLRGLDIAIASLHVPCIKPGSMDENTNALIGAMKNPHVKIIGHPDDSKYPLDYERLVKAAKEHHVLLELNNNSLNPNGFRLNAKENDIKMLNLCKEYGVPITLGSDAHVAEDIANYCYSKEILEITDFPEDLIMNTSIERFKAFLQS